MRKLNEPNFEGLSDRDRATVVEMVKKGATRREVMAWMMAAGATAAAAGSVFGGAKEAWANTPKKGGRMVISSDQHGPADTLDPSAMTASIDYIRSRMVYNGLVRLNKDLSFSPELAEEVLPNGDATEWTFKLKKGVEWHNGKPFTADDVVYTMNRHLGEDSKSVMNSLYESVESWQKVNDYEVKAVLKTPNADLPGILGMFQSKIVQDGQTDFSAPPGTGPFKVAEFKPGVRCVVQRNENYHEDDGPYLDEIESLGIGDSVARVSALLAGDIDIMANLPPKSIEQIEQDSGTEVWSNPSSAYITFACRQDMELSGNRDLVRAMQLLMDRERLVKGVFKGQASLGNDHPIGPAYFDHCADIPQRPMDPDQAKFHFDKSGIGNTPVPVITSEVAPGCVEMGTYLQREASKIGLNIDLKKVTTDGYWSAVWLKEAICAVSWNMRPTANIMLTLAYASTATWNETYWKSEQFDKLLVDVRSVIDPVKRKQMYCDLQTLIYEDGGSITPVYRNYVDAVRTHVKGLTYVPLNAFGGAECPQYLWRDDA